MAERGSPATAIFSTRSACFGFRSSRCAKEGGSTLPARVGDRRWQHLVGCAAIGGGYKKKAPLWEVLMWVGKGLVTHASTHPYGSVERTERYLRHDVHLGWVGPWATCAPEDQRLCHGHPHDLATHLTSFVFRIIAVPNLPQERRRAVWRLQSRRGTFGLVALQSSSVSVSIKKIN